MNTKTMRLPPRRVLTPSGTTNKRKERDDPFDRPKPISTPTPTPTSKLPKLDKPISRKNGSEPITAAAEPKLSNQLLAGYLANEYLTKGTLLGQPWAPSQGLKEKSMEEDGGAEEGEAAVVTAETPFRKAEEERERYAEVAGLLIGGGSHLPGVVNPTQLARFFQL